MKKLFNLFLDTSEYYRLKYDFSGVNVSALKKLKEACAKDIIELYIHKIIESEIKDDLNYEAEKQKKIITDALSNGAKSYLLKLFPIGKKELREKLKDISDIKIAYINEFESFLQETKCIKITTYNGPDDVFNQYFKKLPPFSEKKKCEFPDAFVINSILHYVTNNSIEMIIVSQDKDWLRSLKDKKGIIIKQSLDDALDYIFEKNNNIYSNIIMYIKNNSENINKILKEKVNNAGYFLSDDDGDIEDISNINIGEIDDIYILSKGDDYVSISSYASINLKLKVSIFDEENSLYNKEDSEYIFTNYETRYIDFKEKIYFEANIILDQDEFIDIEIDNFNKNNDFEILMNSTSMRYD